MRGLSVSSPSDAAPSNPAKLRKPNVAAVAIVLNDVPLGILNTSVLIDWWSGAEPEISLTTITTISTMISVTLIPSNVISARVATRMSPNASTAMIAPAIRAITT